MPQTSYIMPSFPSFPFFNFRSCCWRSSLDLQPSKLTHRGDCYHSGPERSHDRCFYLVLSAKAKILVQASGCFRNGPPSAAHSSILIATFNHNSKYFCQWSHVQEPLWTTSRGHPTENSGSPLIHELATTRRPILRASSVQIRSLENAKQCDLNPNSRLSMAHIRCSCIKPKSIMSHVGFRKRPANSLICAPPYLPDKHSCPNYFLTQQNYITSFLPLCESFRQNTSILLPSLWHSNLK